MERSEGKLGARLADRLRCHYADSLAAAYHGASCEVLAVAVGADAVACVAGDGRAHLDAVNLVLLENVALSIGDEGVRRDQDLIGLRYRISNILCGDAPEHPVAQGLDDIASGDERRYPDSVGSSAVILGDDDILRNIDETAGKVAGVRGLERGIGKSLSRAVGGDEVLQYVQSLAEVRLDRGLDDGAVRLRHKSAHSGKLSDLGLRTAGARVSHHED